MNNLTQTLTSNEVADMIGKEHSKLIRDIRTYIGYLNEAKIGSVDFFIESTYQDSKNETRPNYLLTKQGCEMVSNKLTGAKGVQFTAKYVSRFNQMEEHIKQPQSIGLESETKRMNAEARLRNAKVREAKLLAELAEEAKTDVNKALLQDKAVEVLTGSKLLEMPKLKQKLYDTDEIAKKLGVLSKSGQPHGTAVSQIIQRYIHIEEGESEILPESKGSWSGSVIKYSESVIEKAKQWLMDMNYPSQINGGKRNYHVTYDFLRAM